MRPLHGIARRAGFGVAVGVATLGAPGLLPAQGGERSGERVAVDRLAWLAGCWERSSGGGVVEEQWMRPRGATLLGMSRTVRGDTTVEFESMRIYEDRGGLVFAARPSGQPPAEFRSTEVTDSSAAFANPAHDFPQRIVYRRLPDGSLLARVEGTRKGTAAAVDFPYRRAACDG
jgi:hypothetical protein